MPDVHVDSMIFQYPFFSSIHIFSLFFSCIFEVTLHLILSSRLTAFGSLIYLVFPSSACFGFNSYLQCYMQCGKQSVCFRWWWICFVLNMKRAGFVVCCCLGCFGLFLCTVWFFRSLVYSSWFPGVVFSWIQVLLASRYSVSLQDILCLKTKMN